MKVVCIISLIVFCAFTAAAEPVDWGKVHTLTARGINLLYSLEIENAMTTFDSVGKMAPGDPRGPFFQSMVHFYLYGLNRDEKELDAFFEKSERVIEICERILDKNNGDATAKFYLGGIYGYRGLSHHSSGSYLKAARDGRKGYILLEEAVRESPKLYDAHMGFGLFTYLLGKIPSSMRWILTILGFSGDTEAGLNSLRLAAKHGVYTRTEAKIFLAQFLFAEGRRDTALQYINDLRREYPTNTLFLTLYAFYQHRLDNLEEAKKAAQEAIEINKRNNVRYGEELAFSTLGSIYFTLNDFENASRYYNLYMQMTRHDERTPNRTFYRAALANEIVGDRTTAVAYCQRMRKVDDADRAWETFNYRRGQELLRRPISEVEVLVVKGENESSQNNHATAMKFFRGALSKPEASVDVQARALYGIQNAEYEQKMFAEAEKTSVQLVALKPIHEKWIIPHAWYRLGQILAKQGKTSDARRAFQQVDAFDDYDFQSRLEVRVEEELRNLPR